MLFELRGIAKGRRAAAIVPVTMAEASKLVMSSARSVHCTMASPLALMAAELEAVEIIFDRFSNLPYVVLDAAGVRYVAVPHSVLSSPSAIEYETFVPSGIVVG